MGRRLVVVFGLVLLLGVVGLSYASESPAPSGDELPQEPPNNHIGTTSDDDPDSPKTVQGAPIGGPVPPGAFSPPDSHSAASALHVSTLAAAATATALAAFFSF
ncbi:hypothetical protein L6164_010708 [Bauhinia variegata]|uniref:Uncharacterized protein n=1 Tax=Bauhinia variegata TaxID=167791 RepID=A0ACB9P333_BAUVA|nr:hypothetical protein L6164_010708 [Bauhinia variegata]